MIEDTQERDPRTAWAGEGMIFGTNDTNIMIAATLDGTFYFPDDAPIPLVGQDDELQPEYVIVLAKKGDMQAGKPAQPLGVFYGKEEFETFITQMTAFVERLRDASLEETTVRDAMRTVLYGQWCVDELGWTAKVELLMPPHGEPTIFEAWTEEEAPHIAILEAIRMAREAFANGMKEVQGDSEQGN